MSGSPVGRVARAATAPVRGYLNNHFEMVKDEVRRARPTVDVDMSAAWDTLVELENAIAELSLYQARILTRVSDEVTDLTGRIDDLERVVRQLADVVAASTTSSTSTSTTSSTST